MNEIKISFYNVFYEIDPIAFSEKIEASSSYSEDTTIGDLFEKAG